MGDFPRTSAGRRSRIQYDARGRLNRLTNENDETYRFVRGENNRLTEENGLDGVVTRNADGLVLRTASRSTSMTVWGN